MYVYVDESIFYRLEAIAEDYFIHSLIYSRLIRLRRGP